ncbi:CDF family Co(II)/Ni(II) efflux transporter DmeF [Telmatospirillum siberiense]|uniref:Cation transporter n=1 Tax=Telmatospirillum siberiense TaxID=382514 RepID=A0A2N3PMJ3_9PROT|nr:CDF family Co(II)/Ni(II) efflux transporter DmeF [Telmatospirillum siberiense]PKU21615.1 cation transporter [Telmatospirillum siberiense]
MSDLSSVSHDHVFLGAGHERSERQTWVVIGLCGAMMIAEVAGGALFGSVALIADGLHMSTHAGALLIAAWAYTYARRHAKDQRFAFGTGKLGDLAGFSSAIVLAMIALLIGYEAIERLVHPMPIDFDESIPIAVLGLAVNVVSAFLLSRGGHHHHHGHDEHHHHDHDHDHDHDHQAHDHHDPHLSHGKTNRDNNMRAALVHVLADAAVSLLVIVGLLLGRCFNWLWIDPLVGMVGAVVIANWSYCLVRDTGAVLLDMTPDEGLAEEMRRTIEDDDDRLTDLHLWRLGPGHLGAILSVVTDRPRDVAHYRERLGAFPALSHVTVEIQPK